MADVRLIDANALKVRMFRSHEFNRDTGSFDLPVVPWHDIEDADTIDAVEVVRCRNCRLWRRTEKHYGKCPFLIGEHQYTSEDGFCNLGEKMDGGAEG